MSAPYSPSTDSTPSCSTKNKKGQGHSVAATSRSGKGNPPAAMVEGEDPEEVNERIAEFMKDFLQRKVNVANSFTARGARLLDQLPQVIRTEPLKYVGTMLDASAKIYAMRVDNTYGECYSVRSNIEEAQVKNKRRKKAATVEPVAEGDEGGEENVDCGMDDVDIDDDDENQDELGTSRAAIAKPPIARGGSKKHLNAGKSFIAADLAKINRPTAGYSITTEPIYARVVSGVEEGASARSFLNNEVPTSRDGKWLLLHMNWSEGQLNRRPARVVNSRGRREDSVSKELLASIGHTQEIFANRILGVDPTELPLLEELCREDEQLLHLRGDNDGEENNQQSKRRKKTLGEERGQSVFSASGSTSQQLTLGAGSLHGGGNAATGGQQLYLLTRFSPLIDTIWHSEVKVAKLSELQRLGLFLRHSHRHHLPHNHHNHRGVSRRRALGMKSPHFKVPSVAQKTVTADSRTPSKTPTPSPRKRQNHRSPSNNDRSPSAATPHIAAEDEQLTPAARDNPVIFWSRPRTYPLLYHSQVVKENPLENDPLVCKQLLLAEHDSKGAKDDASSSLFTSRAASQAPTISVAASTADQQLQDGTEPTALSGMDEFIAMHQPLSSTMAFIDDEIELGADVSSNVGGVMGGVVEEEVSSPPNQLQREQSIERLEGDQIEPAHDEHWLGDLSRIADDPIGGVVELLGRGKRRRGLITAEADLAKKVAKKTKAKRGRGRKKADTLAQQRRIVEMSWLPTGHAPEEIDLAGTSCFSIASPRVYKRQLIEKKLSKQPHSGFTHTLPAGSLFGRCHSEINSSSTAAGYDQLDLLKSALYHSDDQGFLASCSSLNSTINVQISTWKSRREDDAGEDQDPLNRLRRIFPAVRWGGIGYFNLDDDSASCGRSAGPSHRVPPPDGPLNFDDDEDAMSIGGGIDGEEGDERFPPPVDDEELQFNGGVIRVRQARIRAPLVKRAIALILSSSELDSHSLEELRVEYSHLEENNDNLRPKGTDSSSSESSGFESSEDESSLNDDDPSAATLPSPNTPSTSATPAPVRSKRYADFPVRGEHTFQSLLAHLPSHLSGGTRQDLNVQNAFSISLHMCNERGLRLEQKRDLLNGTVTEEAMRSFEFKEVPIVLARGVTSATTASVSDEGIGVEMVTVRKKRMAMAKLRTDAMTLLTHSKRHRASERVVTAMLVDDESDDNDAS